MQRRKKQQEGKSRVANAKISYRDQSEIMKQIFGNKQLQPQKLNRENYNYNSKPKKPPKPIVSTTPKKTSVLEPLKNPYTNETPGDDLEKAIFDL